MADRPVEQRLVLNSLLCFLLTKLKKVDIKRLRNAISVKYQPECISAAKILLLKDCSSLNLTKALGRYPDRQGVNKAASELNDIFDIVQHLDECNALCALPRYVCDNSDSFPSLPLDEGELAFLFAKLDKMEAIIENLKAAVYAIQAKPLYVASTQALGPNAASSSAGLIGHQLQSQPPTASARFVGALTAENPAANHAGKTTVTNTKSLPMAASTPSQRVHRPSHSWADLAASERRSVDYSSSTGSNYGDVDDEGFQRVKSPRHKRKRVDIGQRELNEQSAATAAGTSKNQLVGSRTTRNSRASVTTEPSGKKNSRQPLLFGRKSTSTATNNSPTVTAARAIKSVYLVDNIDNSCDTESLTNFVKHMQVRVLSCFEVKPRTTRWQRAHDIIPDHRAFRVCINRADVDRFLDESKWPSDVTVSKWYSMQRTDDADRQHQMESDANDDHTVLAGLPPSRTSSAQSSAQAAAADLSDEQREGDRTVIEIELADESMSCSDIPSAAPN
jgi:hypothetical protein